MLLEDQEEAYVASRPNMYPERAARISRKFKIMSDIFSELMSKRHKGGGLNTIKVPIPKKGRNS